MDPSKISSRTDCLGVATGLVGATLGVEVLVWGFDWVEDAAGTTRRIGDEEEVLFADFEVDLDPRDEPARADLVDGPAPFESAFQRIRVFCIIVDVCGGYKEMFIQFYEAFNLHFAPRYSHPLRVHQTSIADM